MNITLTPGNTDDRKPVADLVSSLFGKVFADKGYVSQPLAAQLFEAEGIEFYGVPRRNMKNQLMRLNDKLLSRSGALRSGNPTMKAQQDKRSIIETIIDQLKNISQIVGEAYRRYTFSPSQPCQLLY